MMHDGRLGEGMVGSVDGVDEFNINHEFIMMPHSLMTSPGRSYLRKRQLKPDKKR